jgi:hypothetical protein
MFTEALEVRITSKLFRAHEILKKQKLVLQKIAKNLPIYC